MASGDDSSRADLPSDSPPAQAASSDDPNATRNVPQPPAAGSDTSQPNAGGETIAEPPAFHEGEAGKSETISVHVPDANRIRMDDYELLREIGRGGMGIVYKARQVSLSRVVAVKIILGGNLASSADIQRFEAEAKAVASLKHPHIVGVYEIGEHEGRCFFSMEYIDGQTLDDMIRRQTFTPAQAVSITIQLAEAIQHAHEKGILHRDLKPANVLMDSSGQPKIADFGLAKALNEESGLTATGQALGTPGYMPPEQAEGRIRAICPASDVYALGGVLYAMLTGRPPFKGTSVVETIRLVSEKPPESPRQHNHKVPRDLEAIILKCLEKDPKRRYQSAADLQADLENWQEGRPITAQPLTLPRRILSWTRRHAKTISLAALLVVLPLILVIAFFSMREDPYARLRRQEVMRLVERHLSSPPEIAREPHTTRTEVDTLEQPNTAAFEPISRLQIWDFRGWQPVPEDRMDEPLSAVVMTNRQEFKKVKPANVFRLQARTTGVDVFLRCNSRPDTFKVFAERTPSLVGGQAMKTRQMEIDIADIAIGREFDLETTATYWNGCQRDDQRWIGTVVQNRPFKVSFLVIFPENRPFREYRFRVAELDGYGIRPYEGEQLVIEDPAGKFLFWEIVSPTPQQVYRIDWEW